MKHSLLFTGLLLVVAGRFGQPLAAQSLDPSFASSSFFGSGSVYSAVEQPDGKRLVVGSFSRVNGTAAPSLVRLSPTGALDAGFQQNVGAVSSVFRVGVLGNGQILLTGFGSVPLVAGGLNRNGLLRLNADGTGDATFDPGTGPAKNGQNGAVDYALPLPNGQLLAVGYFDHFNTSLANGIVRLNASGSVDATLNAGTGANDEILTAVALPGGKFLVGGYFTTYNGVARKGLARLNADGSLDPTFNAAAGQLEQVSNLTVQPDGRILVAGYLTNPTGNDVGLFRLLADGSYDSSFSPPAALAAPYATYSYYGNNLELQPDGKILLLSPLSGTTGGVIRLNSNGTLDGSFQPGTGPNSRPLSLTRLASGNVLVAGTFTDFSGTPDRPLVQLGPNGTLDASFQPLVQVPGLVSKLVRQPDGKLLASGSFTEINGQPVRRLARFNPNGTLDNTFAVGAALAFAPVGLELQPDGRLLVASNNTVQRLLASGSPDNSFTPYTGSAVTHLLLQPDGRVLVNVSNTSTFTNSLLRLQANGTADATFTAALSAGRLGYVQGLALQPNGKILVSGNYSPNTGSSYRTVVRLESTGAQDASFALTPISTVAVNVAPAELVVQPDGKVLLGGGQFTAVGGAARVGVARLNADGTHDTGFVPPLFSNTVFKLLLQPNNRILVGGSFVGGVLPSYLARLLPTGAADASYGTTAAPNSSVRTLLVQPDGSLMVGGSFTTIGGVAAPALARLTATNVLHVAAPAAVAARTEAWPVPAHTTLTVVPDAAAHPQTLELLDALGRPVRQQALVGPAGAELSVAGLPAGTYLLRVAYAEGTVVRRVQVQ